MAKGSLARPRHTWSAWFLGATVWPGTVVAAATGATIALVTASHDRAPMEVILAASYSVVLVVLAWIDLRRRVVPNWIVLPAILCALVSAAVGAGPHLDVALLGGLFAAGPFALLFLMGPPGAIGAGDVKMAGFLGVIAGLPSVFAPLLIATVAAAFLAGILRATHRAGQPRLMAYGPFLALGGIGTLL